MVYKSLFTQGKQPASLHELLLNAIWMGLKVIHIHTILHLHFENSYEEGSSFRKLERLFCESWCYFINVRKLTPQYTCTLPFCLNEKEYRHMKQANISERPDLIFVKVVFYTVFPITKKNLRMKIINLRTANLLKSNILKSEG